MKRGAFLQVFTYNHIVSTDCHTQVDIYCISLCIILMHNVIRVVSVCKFKCKKRLLNIKNIKVFTKKTIVIIVL